MGQAASLFAYTAAIQESAKESPFYMYVLSTCMCDSHLPSECALTVPTTPNVIDLHVQVQDYWTELTTLSLMLG